MDYVLVIPSYKRAKTLQSKTYALLKRTNIFDYVKPLIWLKSADDLAEYEPLFPDCSFAYGGTDIGDTRNKIVESYPQDTRIVMIDDDIKEIYITTEKNKKRKVSNLNALIQYAFSCCTQTGTSMFGVYPVDNALFMSEKIRTNLCYMNGSFFGVVNKRISVETIFAEDYERGIKHYLAEGQVCRLEFIGISTRYYKEAGGLQETRTPALNTSHKQRLVDLYPTLVKLVERRGKTELSFLKSKGCLIEPSEYKERIQNI